MLKVGNYSAGWLSILRPQLIIGWGCCERIIVLQSQCLKKVFFLFFCSLNSSLDLPKSLLRSLYSCVLLPLSIYTSSHRYWSGTHTELCIAVLHACLFWILTQWWTFSDCPQLTSVKAQSCLCPSYNLVTVYSCCIHGFYKNLHNQLSKSHLSLLSFTGHHRGQWVWL